MARIAARIGISELLNRMAAAMTVKKDQHVQPSMSGEWAVRSTGSERASKVFESRRDAVKHASEIARREKSELYVHRKDGLVVTKKSYAETNGGTSKGKR